MATADPLAAARAARHFYSTPAGRKARLAELDAEMDAIGHEIDARREVGLPIPPQLRSRLRELGRKRLRIKGGRK